jgi:hypothetical protein
MGQRQQAAIVERVLRSAVLGPCDSQWLPPAWLKPHQVDAARRVRGSLLVFGTALLADAVGLGKTYVALAVASLYESAIVVLPAALRTQWQRVSESLGIDIHIVTHEALSRGRQIGPTGLVVVDEAHRFRNPNTRRYDSLARSIRCSHLLLITATPVVNNSADMTSVLRLGLADNAFAALGLPSLERAVETAARNTVSSATASVVIARSLHSLAELGTFLPQIVNEPTIRLPTARKQDLDRLLCSMDELTFPCVADPRESAFLRLHLLYRLASSVPAAAKTTRHHLCYIDRSIAAAQRGELLTRRAARQVFASDDELQLDLDDLVPVRGSFDIARLREEQSRLKRLLAAFPNQHAPSPKAAALIDILDRRARHKTIVFTSAVTTALHLAYLLRWHRLAVIGAGRSWIASGRVPIEEALAAFAPTARCAPEPPKATQVSTLLATDLASEGLDLQDASAVIHYDLPWTPVKLEQRVGRVARLGSKHTATEVWWFAPPECVERRLNLESRIADKVRCQLGLSVPTTSRVGRTGIVNEMLAIRERIGRVSHRRPHTGPIHSVVRGPTVALLAVNWRFDNGSVPELVLLDGSPPEVIHDYAGLETAIRALTSGEHSRLDPPVELVNCFRAVVRSRLASMDRAPINQSVRRLIRWIVKRAYWEGRRRNKELVDLLDTVLNRLRLGVNVGAERNLQKLLELRAPPHSLRGWLDEQPHCDKTAPGFELAAAIFGDGTVAVGSDQSSPSTGKDFSS